MKKNEFHFTQNGKILQISEANHTSVKHQFNAIPFAYCSFIWHPKYTSFQPYWTFSWEYTQNHQNNKPVR